MIDTLVKLSAGQTSAICALVSLLIDKGVFTHSEAIAAFDQAAKDAAASPGGDHAARPAQMVASFLRDMSADSLSGKH